ncbi:MAG: tRNA 2-selenouridine(34) synthase MnmH [Burkholderiales bacterium]
MNKIDEHATNAARAIRCATLAQLRGFDDILDVRSPSEFHDDHIPGARNFPVLDDAQRAEVGTLYKKTSPFQAKKFGAALVARNIARHLEQSFAAKPPTWKPLVYCWRGGARSAAMAHVLNQVGWQAQTLEGGYKSYRHNVSEQLRDLPALFRFRVVCGRTGSGKSRLLKALAKRGAQVLDLEQLAAHRGSVLGDMPDAPQPTSKMFESELWAQLSCFSPEMPVFVEAESKKIGAVAVPDALLDAMWRSECIRLEPALEQRIALLCQEYPHFLTDTASLNKKLEFLTGRHGQSRIAHWAELARQAAWDTLVAELLDMHYDPAYTRSTLKHYARHAEGIVIRPADLGENALLETAGALLETAPV